MNILIDENIPLLADTLCDSGHVTIVNGRDIDNTMLRNTNCDALFVRSITKVDEQLLANSNVKFVGSATAGIDHVDVKYLSENNIGFVSAPGANANSVAEYVIYTLLVWASSNNIMLKAKKAAVIGYGNVGQIVADYFDRLGMDVMVNDPPLKESGYVFPFKYQYDSLINCCSDADIITNHVPLTFNGVNPTFNLFSQDEINSMKNDTLFIHTSRGKVVNEDTLFSRLSRREITAAIDVWDNEPYVNRELVKYCFMATAHTAGYSYDGKLKGAMMMAEAFEEFAGISVRKENILELLSSGNIMKSVEEEQKSLLIHLEENRNLKEDYIRFLHSVLTEDIEARGAAFDKLRKEYPMRRECLK